MARELIDLGLARAIPPLSNRAVYIVSPLAPIQSITSASRDFKVRFPDSPSLTTILSTLSSGVPKRWDTVILIHRLQSDILPYLMRFGWVVQLRQFYFIKISREIKLDCLDPSVSPEERRKAQDEAQDTILVDPFRATREEVRWIHKLAERVDGAPGRMFERLGKYFDGKSAKEKILRREQVERGELEAMVEALKKVDGIVVAEHW
jgi:nitrogen permease regulator 3